MHRTLLDRSCDEAKSTVSVRVTKQCSLRILPKIKYQEFLIHTLESSNIGSIIIINRPLAKVVIASSSDLPVQRLS